MSSSKSLSLLIFEFFFSFVPMLTSYVLLLWKAYALVLLWGWYMGFTGHSLVFIEAVGIFLVVGALKSMGLADTYSLFANLRKPEGERVQPIELVVLHIFMAFMVLIGLGMARLLLFIL